MQAPLSKVVQRGKFSASGPLPRWKALQRQTFAEKYRFAISYVPTPLVPGVPKVKIFVRSHAETSISL